MITLYNYIVNITYNMLTKSKLKNNKLKICKL